MKILIVCIHFPVASGRHLARALRQLGHDVRTLGPSSGHHIWGMTVDPKWAWEADYAVGPDGGWFIATDWKPDLVVTADSGFTVPGLAEYFGCPHVCYGVDNHVRDYHYADTAYGAVRFDALFVAHSWGHRMGEPNVHWLPAAYEPEDHFDEGRERDLDLALVGVMYPQRAALVQALAGAGLNVLAGTGALYDAYRALYNRAKLSLVAPILDDVPHRFVETMAMGCCVLAPRHLRDAAKMGFEPFRDYVPYDNPDDLVRRAKALAAGDGWREIAANGQRAARPHTWAARARRMLGISAEMGLLQKEPVSQ